jgi:hypothetical protein
MTTTQQIGKVAGVDIDKAQEIHEVLLSEALIDFSEATSRELKTAVSLATWFIDNGKTWE